MADAGSRSVSSPPSTPAGPAPSAPMAPLGAPASGCRCLGQRGPRHAPPRRPHAGSPPTPPRPRRGRPGHLRARLRAAHPGAGHRERRARSARAAHGGDRSGSGTGPRVEPSRYASCCCRGTPASFIQIATALAWRARRPRTASPDPRRRPACSAVRPRARAAGATSCPAAWPPPAGSPSSGFSMTSAGAPLSEPQLQFALLVRRQLRHMRTATSARSLLARRRRGALPLPQSFPWTARCAERSPHPMLVRYDARHGRQCEFIGEPARRRASGVASALPIVLSASGCGPLGRRRIHARGDQPSDGIRHKVRDGSRNAQNW